MGGGRVHLEFRPLDEVGLTRMRKDQQNWNELKLYPTCVCVFARMLTSDSDI